MPAVLSSSAVRAPAAGAAAAAPRGAGVRRAQITSRRSVQAAFWGRKKTEPVPAGVRVFAEAGSRALRAPGGPQARCRVLGMLASAPAARGEHRAGPPRPLPCEPVSVGAFPVQRMQAGHRTRAAHLHPYKPSSRPSCILFRFPAHCRSLQQRQRQGCGGACGGRPRPRRRRRGGPARGCGCGAAGDCHRGQWQDDHH